MRKVLFAALALFAVIGLCQTSVAQTNPQPWHNGVEYFFFNPILPPTNATTITRCFGTLSSIGNVSGAVEGNVHPMGVQQDGFEAWNGQAGLGAGSGSFPLGFSLMAFRCGGTFSQGTGTFVAAASWLTSLPCSAPWFWIVTFGWGTAFTQTPSAGPATKNFYVHIRGEVKQTILNQNYFTGSGNERNLNTGGISFLEDTLLGTAFQLVGPQEWSPSYYQLDMAEKGGRDPSGAGAGFGLDFGTGSCGPIRDAATTKNPGQPKDAIAMRLIANQQLLGISVVTLTLISSPATGGGVSTNGAGGIVLPAGDGRSTNLIPDGVLFPLGLSLSILFKTGGALGGITGDVGLSGVATTISVDLSGVVVPAALRPIFVLGQAISITQGQFGPISNASGFPMVGM